MIKIFIKLEYLINIRDTQKQNIVSKDRTLELSSILGSKIGIKLVDWIEDHLL